MKTHQSANRAIVKLPKLGGHGVLVPGGMILTAAHCIDFSTTGGMVLGDHFIEELETHMGRIKAVPLIVEPVTDIAALGCPDNQIFYKEAEAFENFCETTKPMPLATERIRCRRPFPVRLHDKDGTWVNGMAEMFDQSSPMLWITSEREIKGGASGGPILNMAGELVAIISNSSSGSAEKSTGRCPRPLKALPVWICQEILGRSIQSDLQQHGAGHATNGSLPAGSTQPHHTTPPDVGV